MNSILSNGPVSYGGLRKPFCGPTCLVFEWSTKSGDFTICILDTLIVRYSGVYWDGYCNVCHQFLSISYFYWEQVKHRHWSYEPQTRALVWPYPTLNGNGLKHPSGPVRSNLACTIPIWSTGGWYFVLKMTFFLSCFRLESRWKLENGLWRH